MYFISAVKCFTSPAVQPRPYLQVFRTEIMPVSLRPIGGVPHGRVGSGGPWWLMQCQSCHQPGSASNLTVTPGSSTSARLFLHWSMLEGENLSFQKHFELIRSADVVYTSCYRENTSFKKVFLNLLRRKKKPGQSSSLLSAKFFKLCNLNHRTM